VEQQSREHDALPSIGVAIFITKPIPYVEEFFTAILGLGYPKDKMNLAIYNNQEYCSDEVGA